MSQIIAVNCHACGYATQVPIEMAGQQAQCPSCQAIVTIPPVGMPAAAPLPPQPYRVPSVLDSGQKKGNGALVGWIIGGVAAVAALTVTLILTLGGQDTIPFVPENPDVQQQIQLAADMLNQNVPQRMDEYTELVGVEAGSMELIYKYRVSITLNRGEWQQVEDAVRRGLQSDGRTRNLLNLKVKMTYEYRGPTGGLGHRFTIR